VQTLLDGKSNVVIGGSTGIGLSASGAFVKAGARVMIVGRDPASCAAACDALLEVPG
jgi:NAD(P)-dependent dehydrogenase (short-subunit alcohol dehydrogenase family)